MLPRLTAFDVTVNPSVLRLCCRIWDDNPTGVRLFEFGSGTSLKGFRFLLSVYWLSRVQWWVNYFWKSFWTNKQHTGP